MGDEVQNRKFILLIGRNPVFRNLMAAILTAACYPVLTCADYGEAAVLLLSYTERVHAMVLCVADQGGDPPLFDRPVIAVPAAVAEELIARPGVVPEGVRDVLKRLELLRDGVEQT